MTGASEHFASEWLQPDRGLGLLRLAALYAEPDGMPDEETLDAFFLQVEAGVLADKPHRSMWPELAGGLMSSQSFCLSMNLFGKPVTTFTDHALEAQTERDA